LIVPRTRPERGFTLVELIVVMALLGVMTGVVALSIGRRVARSEAVADSSLTVLDRVLRDGVPAVITVKSDSASGKPRKIRLFVDGSARDDSTEMLAWPPDR
jgi:prepilin-type N-terminal cleavage/methylation domain-containing protein